MLWPDARIEYETHHRHHWHHCYQFNHWIFAVSAVFQTEGPTVNCLAADYLARKPESLVVGGYRGLVACAMAGDSPVGQNAIKKLEALHRRILGPAETRVVLDGLSAFIGTLGHCTTCPLRACSNSCQHLCRDECLILALVAALQHGDDQVGFSAASALTCPARHAEIIGVAGDYAMRMKIFGQVLLPVPEFALYEILAASHSTHPSSNVIH